MHISSFAVTQNAGYLFVYHLYHGLILTGPRGRPYMLQLMRGVIPCQLCEEPAPFSYP